MTNSYQDDICYCDMPCKRGSQRLIDVMTKAIGAALTHRESDINKCVITNFHKEKTRTLHFPALECVGKKPRIAVLGITKGRTQVELAVKYIITGLFPLEKLTDETLIDVINTRAIHAVFAGKQMRTNIAKMFNAIGLWKALDIKYNPTDPHMTTTTAIGEPGCDVHEAFYFASLVKCALLTNDGKSDAPSAKELLSLNAAHACIKRNLFRPFIKYNYCRTVIVFGKTSYEILYQIDNGKCLMHEFERRNINVLFLPHPSGANNATVNSYCKDMSVPTWCTQLLKAKSYIMEATNCS